MSYSFRNSGFLPSLKKKIILFMFGCAGSLLLPGFSAAAESRGCSGPGCECLTAVPSLVAEGGLWGARAAVAVAPGVRE